MELEVLPNEDADPDAAHVKLVEKRVDLRDVAKLEALAVFGHQLCAQLMHAARHRHQRGRMSIINVGEQVVERLLALGAFRHRGAPNLDEGLLVPFAHALH